MTITTSARIKTKNIVKIFVLALIFGSVFAGFLYYFYGKKYFKSINIASCYIKISNTQKILDWTSNANYNCKNLFIANEFVGRKDLFHLLQNLGYSLTENDKNQILDKTKKIEFFYLKTDGNKDSSISDVSQKFSSEKCEEINYWGAKLNCFNELKTKTVGSSVLVGISKENHLKSVIEYLTFLKFSLDKITNPFNENEAKEPYKFITDSGIKIYDGSPVALDYLGQKGFACTKPGGDAEFKKENNGIYICEENLPPNPDEQKRLRFASIIYHEALHQYQQVHAYNDACEYIGGGGTKDKSNVSVYAGHAIYLYVITQNSKIECEDRKYAYEFAQETWEKVCPPTTIYNYSMPSC